MVLRQGSDRRSKDVSETIGNRFFAAIEDLLPESGSLALIPTLEMRVLPLQLAILSDGRRLLERFDVSYCSELSFGGQTNIRASGEGVFVASYSPNIARLPFGSLEARAVAECYDGGAEVASAERATAEAVLSGLREHRIVHLASHGNYRVDSPVDSTLRFTRDLSVREIQIVLGQTPCELIVLSACEAGAGEPARGNAGILRPSSCGPAALP